jgi:hydrogenase 3 maturation protease
MSESQGIGAELRRRLKGRVLLIGAGNTIRGDDGVGPAIIALLEGKVNANLLDVGEVPESYSGRILEAQADTIVFIDTADFGGAPGDVAVLEAEDIAGCSISTHQMPVDLFFRYIRQNSNAEIFALGIQPAQIDFGEPMSPGVAESVRAIAELLKELLPKAGSAGVPPATAS